MNHIYAKPKKDPTLKQKEIPDWFYLTFGMMLVFFSGMEANFQSNTPSQTEVNQIEITVIDAIDIQEEKTLAVLPDPKNISENAN